jgi:uncharacterized protein (TIGR03067 family)
MRTFVLLVVCLFLSPNLRGEDPKDDLQLLQGTWEVVEFTANGRPIPESERMKMKFVVTDSTMAMTARNKDASFEIKLNPEAMPKTIDYKALEGTFKGKTNYGIYELQGDELKLCMHNKDADKPPTEFKSTEGDMLALFLLRRAKP